MARDFQPLDSFMERQHLDPGVTPKNIIEFGFEFAEIFELNSWSAASDTPQNKFHGIIPDPIEHI